MRDIKFRCWDKKSKKMRQVTEIVFNTGFYNETNDNSVKLIWVKGLDIIENKEMQIQRENDFILMQYTGLKDKKGVEIYEGDILPFTMIDGRQENYYIVFRDGEFDAINKQDTNFIWRSAWKESVVIGNIYDNPELLKE